MCACMCLSSGREEGVWFADIQSAGEKRTDGAAVQDGVTGAAGIAAAAWSLHEGVYADAEEAEFRAAEGGSRAPDQRDRSDDVYSGDWAQPAGALDCADPRGPRKGFAGRSVSRGAGDAGFGWGGGAESEPVEVWDEAGQGREEVAYRVQGAGDRKACSRQPAADSKSAPLGRRD